MSIAVETRPTSGGLSRGVAGWWVVLVVAVVAYAARLLPTVRGGGIAGLQGYDGSVYYAAAAGLAHGLLPYRDFLLLHPPGIVVALLPFALLGRLLGHDDAYVIARLAWIGLGAVNAILVSRILAPYGRAAALLGGLGYAVFVPALYVEHSTALEGVASAGLLAAMLLLTRPRADGVSLTRPFLLAGVFLGVSISVKIWGVLILAAVLLWCLLAVGRRLTTVVAAGAAVGATIVCLPFFVVAPAAMWRMVVLDQLGRRRVPFSWVDKLNDMAGFPSVPGNYDHLVLVLALSSLAVGVVLALRNPAGRLAVVIFAGSWIALLASPSWTPDYASLAGPALAVMFGAGVATLVARVHHRWLRVTALSVLAVLLAGYTAKSLEHQQFGSPFPAAELRAGVENADGCVTSDHPAALILTGALDRNLGRGCELMVDLGGYSYDLRPTADLHVSRARNAQWNQFTLEYLGSGSATMIVRFRNDTGFSAQTKRVVSGWPEVVRSGEFTVQRPVPLGAGQR